MAKGNFDRCLAEILKHEGGFVNHPLLDMVNKLPYNKVWSTQKNSQKTSFLLFSKKVHFFIKRLTGKILDHIYVKLTGALMMHSQMVCAMRIILGSAKARIYLLRFGIAAKAINAWNVMARLMGKVDGRFVKAITTKGGGQSYGPFVLRPLVDVAKSVGRIIRTMFMTFTTLVSRKKILPLVMLLKAWALMRSLLKFPSASSYAPIVIG